MKAAFLSKRLLVIMPMGAESPNCTSYQRIIALSGITETIIFTLTDSLSRTHFKKVVFKSLPWGLNKSLIAKIVFIIWVLKEILINYNSRQLNIIYSTYMSSSLIIGRVLKALRYKWIIDFWDHPMLSINTKKRLWESKSCTVSRVVHLMMYDLLTLITVSIIKQSRKADIILSGIDKNGFRKYHFPQEKMISVPHGTIIPCNRTKRVSIYNIDKCLNMLYVGYIGDIRGLTIMLKSMQLLKQKNVNFHLRLIGPLIGIRESQLHDKIAELGLSKRIEYLGVVPYEKVLQIITSSEIGLFPFQDFEELEYIYPIKVFEYMALGLVSVCSDLEGVRKIISHGVNGILFKAGSYNDLTAKLTFIYNHPTLMRKIASQAIKDAKQYDWNIINYSLQQFLKDAVFR